MSTLVWDVVSLMENINKSSCHPSLKQIIISMSLLLTDYDIQPPQGISRHNTDWFTGALFIILKTLDISSIT